MPTAGGPNTLGESNLVFAYDTGDVKNSYKGQPTVNTFGTYPTDLYSWASSGNACTLSRDTISSPVGSTPLKMVTTGNDAYTSTYNRTGNNISAASSGQTWTISVWAKANQNTTGQIFHFGANSSGNIIDFSATAISLTTEWTRYTYTRTFTNGNVVAIQARLDGANTFQSGDIIWWDGLQVEQKSYATQFTTGTRSATQGLLPLIGNSTLDLTNMSFDSNAKMSFDGTNDYIAAGNPTDYRMGVNDFTLECVMKQSKTTGHCLLETRGNSLVGYLWVHNYYNTGQSCLFLNYGGNQYLYFQDGGFVATTTTQYYHMAIVVNRAGNTISFYVNGNKAGNDVAIHSNSISPTGGDIYRVGFDLGGSPWQGEIPVFRHYNRTLSGQEIKQNYQQYKTRFNLS